MGIAVFLFIFAVSFGYEQHVSPAPLPPTESVPVQTALFLEENIGDGFEIRLSDGSLWEVAPQDRIHSALWLGPIQVRIEFSEDPDYPNKMTNVYTKLSILVRPVIINN